MSSIHFQLWIISKWLAKHISTKGYFKITNNKRHVYIHIGWSWIWNEYFYLEISNYDRTKIIVFPSFQLATRLNSQNSMKLILLSNSDSLHFLWILVYTIGIIEVSTPRNEVSYYISVPYKITDIQAPETLYYIPRGAKWSDVKKCISSPQKKKKSFET